MKTGLTMMFTKIIALNCANHTQYINMYKSKYKKAPSFPLELLDNFKQI
jgi:hypothetical protein